MWTVLVLIGLIAAAKAQFLTTQIIFTGPTNSSLTVDIGGASTSIVQGQVFNCPPMPFMGKLCGNIDSSSPTEHQCFTVNSTADGGTVVTPLFSVSPAVRLFPYNLLIKTFFDGGVFQAAVECDHFCLAHQQWTAAVNLNHADIIEIDFDINTPF
ncbi:hypothetical protein FB451DRAFT_1564009 [Mycena latifolia]|nr:hypothetical protein FB451DRAFT_1564009 [Mycena latifolia]